MKMITCPILGRRAVSEFVVGGVLECEPAELGETSAADWVYRRNSVPMERTEWWFHSASQMWFTVKRDTAADTILQVQAADE